MHPLLALALVGALVVGSTALGLVWRAGQGRLRPTRGTESVVLDGVDLGTSGTLLQFSSEYCAPCRATARVLGELAARTPGLAHVEIDVAERPELAARFDVLQTPTTLVLDATGRPRTRIAGAVRSAALQAELARIVPAPEPLTV